jgi:hypothetical protein
MASLNELFGSIPDDHSNFEGFNHLDVILAG